DVTFDPTLSESLAVVHAHEQLDADITLQRGRIVLRNQSKDKSLQVRVRFDNPTLAEENYFDLLLYRDSAVVLERVCALERDDPFYDNPKDKTRKGPTAIVRIFPYARQVRVRWGGNALSVDAAEKRPLEWQSRRGVLGVSSAPELPSWLTGKPPAKVEV